MQRSACSVGVMRVGDCVESDEWWVGRDVFLLLTTFHSTLLTHPPTHQTLTLHPAPCTLIAVAQRLCIAVTPTKMDPGHQATQARVAATEDISPSQPVWLGWTWQVHPPPLAASTQEEVGQVKGLLRSVSRTRVGP